ncbi:ATP-binding protein [Streptomyces sp. NPDC088752]|uniref:ATP-binding protein n=1 Tax=Streptomyces sp. NPDC088752 TaxID=3154963 RepID=UPI00343CFE3F
MTTTLAGQGCTRRRAAAAREARRREGVHPAIELSISRCIDPDFNGMSEKDAAWAGRLREILRSRLAPWNLPELLDKAELLLTELVTNAFQHASGPTVDVCVRRQDDRLKITVDDHSTRGPLPRSKGLYEEHGRGLILVDALSDAWGISKDRTTTWCTLCLPEGLPAISTGPAPVRNETMIRVPADTSGLHLAGIHGRTAFAILDWPGDRQAAFDVLHSLASNALRHGITQGWPSPDLRIWVRVTKAHELIIDVKDPNPDFPKFETNVVGELGRGLWVVRRFGAKVSWAPDITEGGKTVRAVMQPGQVAL